MLPLNYFHLFTFQLMVGAEGLPVGVQVVTLKWRDELCLRVMKEVESASDLPPIGV